MKSKDFDLVMGEARRMRRAARALPPDTAPRRHLEAATARLEAIAQRLAVPPRPRRTAKAAQGRKRRPAP